jgi:hypothetical protein
MLMPEWTCRDTPQERALNFSGTNAFHRTAALYGSVIKRLSAIKKWLRIDV